MKKIFLTILCPGFLFAGNLESNPYPSRANFICSQITTHPEFIYGHYFSESFQQQIAYEDLVGIFKEIAKEDGPCNKAVILSIQDSNVHVRFVTNTNAQMAEFRLDEKFQIDSLKFYGLENPKE